VFEYFVFKNKKRDLFYKYTSKVDELSLRKKNSYSYFPIKKMLKIRKPYE